jgi:hypothetical protein
MELAGRNPHLAPASSDLRIAAFHPLRGFRALQTPTRCEPFAKRGGRDIASGFRIRYAKDSASGSPADAVIPNPTRFMAH